jgi:pyruvate/2-oxoglutarate/acetoin dehydrogenase E1 component
MDTRQPAVSVYVEEASIPFGWSSEMLAQVDETAASGAGRAVRHARIGSASTPIPSGRGLERKTLPQVDDIVAGVLECF